MQFAVNPCSMIIPGFENCLNRTIELLIWFFRKLVAVFGIKILVLIDQFLMFVPA